MGYVVLTLPINDSFSYLHITVYLAVMLKPLGIKVTKSHKAHISTKSHKAHISSDDGFPNFITSTLLKVSRVHLKNENFKNNFLLINGVAI